MPKLTLPAARALHLEAQGLRLPPRRRARKDDVLAIIARMQLLQIDTIHVVARSPYLVLFSRLGDYRPEWLDEWLERARVFEVWAHEACFASMDDWPMLHAAMRHNRHHWAVRSGHRNLAAHETKMRRLLEHVRDNGPVRSSDFERTHGQGGGWWQWKDEKRWLEAWFALGELMVARRERFQRVYDLSERVLMRAGIEFSAGGLLPVDADHLRLCLIERSVQALGIARRSWLADYFRLRPAVADGEVRHLLDTGRIQEVRVRGWEDEPFYVHTAHEAALRIAMAGRLHSRASCLLSPFDPVIWDRRRVSELFGFDYRLECYVSAPKRRFGYFVLPFLHRGCLHARLDAKVHREQSRLQVKGVWTEPDVVIDLDWIQSLAQALARFARWNGAQRIDIDRTDPARLCASLQQQANAALVSMA